VRSKRYAGCRIVAHGGMREEVGVKQDPRGAYSTEDAGFINIVQGNEKKRFDPGRRRLASVCVLSLSAREG